MLDDEVRVLAQPGLGAPGPAGREHQRHVMPPGWRGCPRRAGDARCSPS
jgi:hypothetical protein